MSARTDVLKYFKLRRILIPLALGLLVSVYFVFGDGEGGFSTSDLSEINWSKGAVLWLCAAIGLMVVRDFGYILRLRILTDGKMTWRQCFQVIMLWEFASAVSPGAIGGTAAAVVIMAQEKLRTGLTTAIVLITSFLDELYYMIMVPVVFWAVGNTSLFPDLADARFENVVNTDNLRLFFWGGYLFLLLWTVFLAFALFIKPEISTRIIRIIISLPVLKRFRRQGLRLAEDLHTASQEFRRKPASFWLRSFGATALTWTARFLVINCLIMLLTRIELHDHWMIFGKQLVMWILMMIAITPGGSGISELVFVAFIGNYLPGKKITRQFSVLWRMITYYPYMLLGAIVLPFWMKRVGLRERLTKLNLSKKKA